MIKRATFAGGCFWCMQAAFDFVEGVLSTVAGYVEVDGHKVEAVSLTYDDAKVPYEVLLDVFWHNIDPEDSEGQFADRGPTYRTYIFYHDEEQKRLAEKSKRSLQASGKFERIATEIRPFTSFERAPEPHQKFYLKNPERYEQYKEGSGRGPYLRKVWGKLS